MFQRVQHTYLTLPNQGKCFTLLSGAPEAQVERAVVFVHGFNGTARGTWADSYRWSMIRKHAATGGVQPIYSSITTSGTRCFGSSTSMQ